MDIQFSLVPEDFLERITKNPNSRFSDFEIRLAIDVLRIYVRDGIQDESHEARELLKKANLRYYIEKQSQYRKTEDHNLKYWKTNVPTFLRAMSELINQAESIWNKNRRKHIYDKEEVIKEILTKLFKVDNPSKNLDETSLEDIEYTASQDLGDTPSQDLIDRVGDLDGGRTLYLANLCLSIFAETQDISYSSLRKFYYSKDVREKGEELEILEEKYKQGQFEITNLNSQAISDEELSNNPELSLQIDKQAYIKYVENKLSKTKNISANFRMDLLALANE